jgi:hypothetical protein
MASYMVKHNDNFTFTLPKRPDQVCISSQFTSHCPTAKGVLHPL